MATIENLLNFRINPDHHRELGTELVSAKTERRIRTSIEKLQKISMDSQSISGTPPEGVEVISELFMDAFETKPEQLATLFFSRSRLRMLSYAIGFQPVRGQAIIHSPEATQAALELLIRHWQPEFTRGLLDVMLQHWSIPARSNIGQHLRGLWLQNPQQLLPSIHNLDAYLFSNSGPHNWAKWLIENDKPLINCYLLLGFREHTRSYDYFRLVARGWLDGRLQLYSWEKALLQIREWLSQTPGDNTHAKQLLVPLILRCDQQRGDSLSDAQKLLHQLSDEFIGLPEQKGRWQPWPHIEIQESVDLEMARCAVESWVKQLFIEVFFQELSQDADSERTRFWSKYTHHIESFKIYGNNYSYRLLMKNPKLKPYVSKHWGNLLGDSKQHVFVMKVKKYLLIEFGQKGGAFYGVYQDNPYAPQILFQDVHVSDFRPEQCRDLIWPNSHTDFESKPEGRMPHASDWSRRLSYWLERYVLNG
jgi:hypothetical protein